MFLQYKINEFILLKKGKENKLLVILIAYGKIMTDFNLSYLMSKLNVFMFYHIYEDMNRLERFH